MGTTQPGGVYKVGDKLVDAEGKETKRSKAGAASTEATTTDPNALPDDFPARKDLVGAGFTTRDAVAAASDEQLVAIKGIGEKTVAEIREALK